MSNTKTLMPCPFCGGEDIETWAFSFSEDCCVQCATCNAGIELQVAWKNMNETEHDKVCQEHLAAAWNRRAY